MLASVCVGNYATTPYCVAGLGIPVYSMEELCYCMKENAFLLDVDLMSDALLEWIDKECGLRELTRELYPLVHKRGSLSAFVIMIMEYTGFYSLEIIRNVETVLKQGAGLSNIEKRKSQVDYLVQKKNYAAAVKGYDALLARWEQSSTENEEKLPATDVKAAILYNRGAVLARMLMYEQAADSFWMAYQQDGREDYFVAYLGAKRMGLSDEEYISFTAELQGSYTYSLALEKRLEELLKLWTETAEYQRLAQREEWRDNGSIQKYYNENDRITLMLKNAYRNSMVE